jgi:hypothetical protein
MAHRDQRPERISPPCIEFTLSNADVEVRGEEVELIVQDGFRRAFPGYGVALVVCNNTLSSGAGTRYSDVSALTLVKADASGMCTFLGDGTTPGVTFRLGGVGNVRYQACKVVMTMGKK